MPFKSEAQRRKFYAMASRGEISKETVKEWQAATPKGKKLPEHVAKHASLSKQALLDAWRMMNPAQKGSLLGTGIGGLTGAYIGYDAQKKRKKDIRLLPIATNALILGWAGRTMGRSLGELKMLGDYARAGRQYGYAGGSRYAGGAARPSKPPSWVGNPTTKAEAKSAFRREAMKHHPDLGGNEESMKQVNLEWDRFTKSPLYEKLAMAFFDELSKIASEVTRVTPLRRT